MDGLAGCAGAGRPSRVGVKILLDVNVSFEFADHLADAIGMPDAVFHVVKVGWKHKRNGDLQQTAVAEGYSHLVTHDKDMADKHKPHLPVLVTDNPDHGEEGREPGTMTADEISSMTLAAAGAVADRLLRDPPPGAGYTGVAIPGYRPRKRLQRVLDGEHGQHPAREANREASRRRRIEEQRAVTGQPRVKENRGVACCSA